MEEQKNRSQAILILLIRSGGKEPPAGGSLKRSLEMVYLAPAISKTFGFEAATHSRTYNLQTCS
jgi:hypothetical protein